MFKIKTFTKKQLPYSFLAVKVNYFNENLEVPAYVNWISTSSEGIVYGFLCEEAPKLRHGSWRVEGGIGINQNRLLLGICEFDGNCEQSLVPLKEISSKSNLEEEALINKCTFKGFKLHNGELLALFETPTTPLPLNKGQLKFKIMFNTATSEEIKALLALEALEDKADAVDNDYLTVKGLCAETRDGEIPNHSMLKGGNTAEFMDDGETYTLVYLKDEFGDIVDTYAWVVSELLTDGSLNLTRLDGLLKLTRVKASNVKVLGHFNKTLIKRG